MVESKRNKIHKKLSDHEKQFAYLPLDVLKKATNIGELVLPTIAKGNPKYVDFVINQVHEQMPIKCGKWCKELAGLRFVETIEEFQSDPADEPLTENVATKKPARKSREPAPELEPQPSTSKSTPKSAKNASTSIEKPQQSSRVTRNRKVNFKIS